jgi:hypothetical protein
MATTPDAGSSGGDGAPDLTWWQRLKYTIVRPDDGADAKTAADDRSVEEIEQAIRRSDDKERAVGLVAAPLAAIIGVAISSESVNYAKAHHQSVTVYNELTYVILGMSVLILVSSWLRKRLFQGITMVLYGLAVFNLHYWGFGIPFLLGGSWYLVNGYRLQQALKRAGGGSSSAPPRNGSRPTNGSRPRANKRYTPPT